VDRVGHGGPPPLVDARIAFGRPLDEIRRRATVSGVDLLIVGAQRSRWLGRAFLGGTARRLLVDPPVPLLLVHPAVSDKRPFELEEGSVLTHV
jgi:nucleotide-binding universal stress UspA family protein